MIKRTDNTPSLFSGLLIVKHLRNLSDESVVEQWSGNAYYQYFCGMQEFVPTAPRASSELVHFRNRIGEQGVELIFKESVRVNNGDDDSRHHDTAFIDTTVQEKNVTFPTDAKLHKRIVKKVLDIITVRKHKREESNIMKVRSWAFCWYWTSPLSVFRVFG